MGPPNRPQGALVRGRIRLQSVLNSSLDQYKKTTKNDLLSHQLATQFESCTSPSTILAVLEEKYHVQEFIHPRSDNERPKQWLNATASVLWAFSVTQGVRARLVCGTSKK
jgi:hypothetical protein